MTTLAVVSAPESASSPAPALAPARKPARPTSFEPVPPAYELDTAELLTAIVGARHAGAALELFADLGWVGIGRASLAELAERVGPACAKRLIAARELGRRCGAQALPFAAKITGPDAVAAFLRGWIGAEEQECFVVLGLDAHSRVRYKAIVHRGTTASVEASPRDVFAPLIRERCIACIVAHNHPSDCAEPSAADIELTHRMAQAGQLLGIKVMDHVVVARSSAVSLAARGHVLGA